MLKKLVVFLDFISFCITLKYPFKKTTKIKSQ